MVVVPTYRCSRCEREGLMVQDMVLVGRIRKRDGQPSASWCKPCNNARHRSYYRRDPERFRAKARADYAFRMRVDPETQRRKDRERRRERMARDPKAKRKADEAQARYRERLRADPERHERKKAQDRLAHRRRQQRLGRDPATIVPRVVPKADKTEVPLAGITRALGRYLTAKAITAEDFAAASGISARTIGRWFDGQESTDIETADRALQYLGLLPHDVWDEDVLVRLALA